MSAEASSTPTRSQIPRGYKNTEIYNIDTGYVPPDDDIGSISGIDMGEIELLRPYSLINGPLEDIHPYLLRGSIEKAYHWVPVNGITPHEAVNHVDAFIKSAYYQYRTNAPSSVATAKARKAAIVIGTARAVMTANYELTTASITPNELAAPVLVYNEKEAEKVKDKGKAVEGSKPSAARKYTPLLAKNAEGRNFLEEEWTFNEEELTAIRVIIRSAQAVLPIQGLNLMTDGHHYLSEKSKPSYKAFLAVERQVWIPSAFKSWIEGEKETIQDWLWHKSGHPVTATLKTYLATSDEVVKRLNEAKLGSATARLPALEADARAASAHMKLCEAVDAVWATMGGGINPEIYRVRLEALENFPRGRDAVAPQVTVPPNVVLRSRDEAMKELRRIVKINMDSVAMAYGFYVAMVEASSNETGERSMDTLRSAFSLKKLATECPAAYMLGVEYYKDFRAAKMRARNEGTVKMPMLSMTE